MRRLAVLFVAAVLLVTAVSLVSGGTLTGERIGGGYAARWSVGCSLGNTGPHQCLSGRADNSASYCSVSSTGPTSMVQNCNECYCNSASGVNNFYCQTTTGQCLMCSNTCASGNPGSTTCAASLLQCQQTGGLCDGTYSCFCNDGFGGLCTGFVCSGRRSADRTCTTGTTCGTTAYSCVSGRCGADCSTGYTEIVRQCIDGGAQWMSYQLSCTSTCQVTSNVPTISNCNPVGDTYCVGDTLRTSTGCDDADGCTSSSVLCDYGCSGSLPNAYCEPAPSECRFNSDCDPCHRCRFGSCQYQCTGLQVCQGGTCLIPCQSCEDHERYGLELHDCSCSGVCTFTAAAGDVC